MISQRCKEYMKEIQLSGSDGTYTVANAGQTTNAIYRPIILIAVQRAPL